MPSRPAAAKLARMLGTADLALAAGGLGVVLSGAPAYFWWRNRARTRQESAPHPFLLDSA